VLDRQYPRHAIFETGPGDWRPALRRLEALPPAAKESIQLLRGHMGFGAHRALGRPASYVTLLRDPVERIISHYRYVLRTPGHYLHEEVVGRRLGLREYAASDLAGELENGQTRLLGTADDAVGGVSEATLAAAKRNIGEHFVLAGLAERFDESMLLLRELLDWRRPVLYDRVNVAPRDAAGAVDLRTRELIRERNHLDVALYAHCAASLEHRLAEAGAEFMRELRLFRLRNMPHAAVLATARRARRHVLAFI